MAEIHVNKEYKKWMFFLAYGIYLISVILYESQYGKMECLDLFFPVVRFIAYGLICVKVILDFLEREYSWKELLVVVGIGILLLVSAYESKNKNLLIYWVFIVASHDIDFQQIIKWALFLHLGVLLFVIGSSYGGIVENQIYIQDNGNRIRESLGFHYATQGSHHYFYIILFWIYWRKDKITWKELAVMTAANIYFFVKTDTKNAFALGMLAIIGAAILKCIPYLREYKKIYSLIAAGIVPMVSAGIIGLSVKYDESVQWMQKINRFVTGRLVLGHNEYLTHKPHLFGQPIVWTDGGHYYVDSSYMQVLLCLGIVILIVVVTGLVTLGISIMIKRDTYFLLVFSLFSVHSTFDAQLVWIGYNAFIMAYSYIKNAGKILCDERKGEKSDGSSTAKCITAAR